jgi:hypothetical protein
VSSNLLAALPSSFHSHPVIPYPPNGPDDRGHVWDWTGRSKTIASGLTVASVDPAIGTESFTLRYVGLTRADARAIESFVETQLGRIAGFFCPTFQHDFYATAVSGEAFTMREWGYATKVYPVTNSASVHIYKYFAAYYAGSWGLCDFNGVFSSAGTDASGYPLQLYTANSGGVTGSAVWHSTANGSADGLAVMRLLYCRFADDAVTTTWDHPALANIELRVVAIPDETPA